MRKQYHFKLSPNGYYAWDIDKLIDQSRSIKITKVKISGIKEVDMPYWYGDKSDEPTCRSIVDHFRLINIADLSFPIIMGADRSVMDGMHRVARALFLDHTYINAKIFNSTPPPDFVDVHPDELAY